MKNLFAFLKFLTLCFATIFGILLFSWAFLIPSGKRESIVMKYGGTRWARFCILLTGVRTLISGAENIPAENKGFLSISNHLSFFDILILIDSLRISFMAKSSLLYTPFGWGAYMIGAIFIDRGNVKDQIKSMYRALERSKNLICIHVFPEGTRSTDGEILPFKKGLFALAYKQKMPILISGLWGSHKIAPAKQLQADFSYPAAIHVNGLIHPQDFSGSEEFFLACEESVKSAVSKAKKLWESNVQTER